MSLIKNVVRTNNQLVLWNEGEEIFSVSRNSDGTPSEIKSRVGRWPKQESTFQYNVLGEFTGMSYPIESAMLPALIAEANNTVTARKQLTGGIEITGPDFMLPILGSVQVVSSTGEASDTLTGTTDPQRMALWTFPKGSIQKNDVLVFIVKASNSNSANVKYLSLYAGETEVAQVQNTTNTTMGVLWTLGMRNSLNSQVGNRLNSSGIGITAGAFATASVDFSEDVDISLRGWTLASPSEFIVIESHMVLLVRGQQ